MQGVLPLSWSVFNLLSHTAIEQIPKPIAFLNPNPRNQTQKANLFKGKAKKKSIPPNRHGKAPVTRKGKRFVKPSKVTKDMDADREVSKFINQCNEIKAATLATKDGGQLGIIKTSPLEQQPSGIVQCIE